MIKKITTIGTVSLIIIVIIAFSIPTESNQETVEQNSDVKADVIMPTKVSRPGCEEQDRCYLPPQITVEKGDEVTWINEDSAFHSVTSGKYDEPTNLFDSGHLDPSEYFSFTFESAGVFDYYCTLHPWMKGQVIVK